MPPKSKKASSLTLAPKIDPMTLLFRNEVRSLLGNTPTSRDGHPIEVLAAIERLSASGLQQSVQLCRAGEETWVTRTEGAREFFPRVGRVQKRARDADEIEEVVTPRKVVKVLPTPQGKGKKAPGAPRKLRHASSPTPDGGETDRESLRSNETIRRNVIEALGRGTRRSTRKSEEYAVKAEDDEGEHDLASLCGRVGGLDVQSTIGEGESFLRFSSSLRWTELTPLCFFAESEYERPFVGGVASTSRLPARAARA